MAYDSTQSTGANKPVSYLYFSKPSLRRGGNDRLVRIGAVFAHRSGKGRTLLIDALPVDPNWDGRLIELEASDYPDDPGPASAAPPPPVR